MNLETQRLLSEFSTFGIGGPIRYFTEATDLETLKEAFLFAKENKLPFIILGKGSNSLFDDRGFDGLAILNKIDFCCFIDSKVTVGGGYSFSLLGAKTAKKGLSGLEFASGIPGSVGGAVYMNAGANGQETADTLESVHFLTSDGEEKHFQKNELQFSYRTSSFQKMKGCIISAAFLLKPNPEARPKQLQIIQARMKTQPTKDKSAGCVFRNPKGVSAGALIDQCGLKGVAVGGAKVSEIHANFIVNDDHASAKDVLALIGHVQKTVYEKTGIQLEPEIRLLS